MFCKKGVLRNFPNFIEKRLCQGLFYNKVAGLRRPKQVARLTQKFRINEIYPKNYLINYHIHMIILSYQLLITTDLLIINLK